MRHTTNLILLHLDPLCKPDDTETKLTDFASLLFQQDLLDLKTIVLQLCFMFRKIDKNVRMLKLYAN